MDPDKKRLDEIYQLEKENNHMLHKMRRNAFWGRLIYLLFYAALLGIPIWLYLTYLMPVLKNFNDTVNKVQGTSASFQANFSNIFKQFQERFGGSSTAK